MTLPPFTSDFKWFPDGRSLLMTVNSKDPRGYYRVDLTHGDTQLFYHAPPSVYWDLSRDGKTIYYSSIDPATRQWGGLLIRCDVETGHLTELKRSEARQIMGSVAASPDGTQLAYVLSDDGTGESSLELMPAGGGDSREVFRAPWSGNTPFGGVAWSPNQRFLMFVREVSAPGGPEVSVYRVPVTGGAPVNTGISFQGRVFQRVPSIHPDGRHIAYSVGKASPEVRVMENYLPRAAAR